jgi:DNA-binding HxlR family transcriptional regulator
VKRTSLATADCPIARALDVVGDPWTLLVVRDAFFGARRFDDFRRSLGIPRATLAARLATLVEHGVFDRREYSTAPSRHEYVLTAKGRSLGPLLVAMLHWGDEWSDLGDAAVELVDADTGRPVRPVYVDGESAQPIADLRLTRRRRNGEPVGVPAEPATA